MSTTCALVMSDYAENQSSSSEIQRGLFLKTRLLFFFTVVNSECDETQPVKWLADTSGAMMDRTFDLNMEICSYVVSQICDEE